MIPKGLFAQIGMVILSVAIIITYVEPAFRDIGEVQDNIAVYQTEKEKVSLVNDQLNSLLQIQKDVSLVDQNRLLTYMPDEDTIDPIAIPRDLALISVQAGVIYKNAAFVGSSDKSSADVTEEDPQAYTFSYSVEGTYTQVKNLFSLLEQNHYPLEVRDLSISRIEGGFLSVEMTIDTYAYRNSLPTNTLVF